MARRSLSDSRVLITGASSGIGRALALELGRRGARLLINARRVDRLQLLADELILAGAQVELVAGDVTLPETRALAVRRAQQRYGGLDVLVNNAGIGARGRFDQAQPDRLRQIMEVNLFALAEMTRAALPALKQGRRPIVVNVGSILGRRAIPQTSEYCASKFAVCGLSEALRAELARDGVDVLLVNPGTTESEFVESLIDTTAASHWPEQPKVPAAVVAASMARAIELGRHEIIPNFRGRLLCYLNRLAPRIVDAWMSRYSR